MVYAHCMNRQVINATSCPAATAVVQPDALVLHLFCFKEQAIQKAETDTLIPFTGAERNVKIIYW